MPRITKPLHFLKVVVAEMTIGGSDLNFFQPREMPCSLYPGNFCDVFLTCSGFFSLFQSCLPHGRIISHRLRKPRPSARAWKISPCAKIRFAYSNWHPYRKLSGWES